MRNLCIVLSATYIASVAVGLTTLMLPHGRPRPENEPKIKQNYQRQIEQPPTRPQNPIKHEENNNYQPTIFSS